MGERRSRPRADQVSRFGRSTIVNAAGAAPLKARGAALWSRLERTAAGQAAVRFGSDLGSERAAALAFYVLFSFIPTLLLAAAVLTFFGSDAVAEKAQEIARDQGASASLAGVVHEMFEVALRSAPSEAGAVGLASLGVLVYGASKAFSDAGRALDQIRRRPQLGRSLTRRALDLVWTVVLLVMAVVFLALVFVSGQLLRRLFDALGVQGLTNWSWNLIRWPAAAAIALLIVAIVTWAAPTGAGRPFRLITPGGATAVALWLVATAGYAVYLSHFAHYNATYGAFAAIIILMLWAWYSCLAFLYGAELDAVLEDRRDARRR